MEFIISIAAITYILVRLLNWHLAKVAERQKEDASRGKYDKIGVTGTLIVVIVGGTLGFWCLNFIAGGMPLWLGWPVFIVSIISAYRLWRTSE